MILEAEGKFQILLSETRPTQLERNSFTNSSHAIKVGILGDC
jgi:hypothetical protein